VLPEISTARELTDRLIHMARFVLGLGLLLAVAAAT
jgi:hypothetical protein